MYEGAHDWYRDSFYNIPRPWEERRQEGYETPMGGRESESTYGFHTRPLTPLPPIPFLDVSSLISTPSTVEPSVSAVGEPLQERRPTFPVQQYEDDHMTPKGTGVKSSRIIEPRRVHYEDDTPRHSHPQIETRSTYNQVTKTPSTSSVTTVAQSDSVIPLQSPNVMSDGGGPIMGATTHQEKSMDITTSGNDIYYGEYPNFVLPLPGQPRISDVFVGNSNLHSDAGSPMSILKISCLKKMYNTKDFAIDRNNGRLYTIIGTSVTPIDLYGVLPEDSQNNMPVLTTTPSQLMIPIPQATSTLVTETNMGTSDNSIPRNSILIPTPARIPTSTSKMPSSSSSSLSDGTMEGPEYNKYRAQLEATRWVSSLDEKEGVMTEQEYSSTIKCLEKITKKTTILMRNWNAEGKTAKSKEEKKRDRHILQKILRSLHCKTTCPGATYDYI